MLSILATSFAGAQQVFKPGQGDNCPCFSQDDIATIPTPYEQCIMELELPRDGTWSNIIHEQGIVGCEVKFHPIGRSAYCSYWDSINYPDSEPVYVFGLTTAQAETCNRFIVNVIVDNIDQCETLFTGEAE
jgi:hypothetical protein